MARSAQHTVLRTDLKELMARIEEALYNYHACAMAEKGTTD